MKSDGNVAAVKPYSYNRARTKLLILLNLASSKRISLLPTHKEVINVTNLPTLVNKENYLFVGLEQKLWMIDTGAQLSYLAGGSTTLRMSPE